MVVVMRQDAYQRAPPHGGSKFKSIVMTAEFQAGITWPWGPGSSRGAEPANSSEPPGCSHEV